MVARCLCRLVNEHRCQSSFQLEERLDFGVDYPEPRVICRTVIRRRDIIARREMNGRDFRHSLSSVPGPVTTINLSHVGLVLSDRKAMSNHLLPVLPEDFSPFIGTFDEQRGRIFLSHQIHAADCFEEHCDIDSSKIGKCDCVYSAKRRKSSEFQLAAAKKATVDAIKRLRLSAYVRYSRYQLPTANRRGNVFSLSLISTFALPGLVRPTREEIKWRMIDAVNKV